MATGTSTRTAVRCGPSKTWFLILDRYFSEHDRAEQSARSASRRSAYSATRTPTRAAWLASHITPTSLALSRTGFMLGIPTLRVLGVLPVAGGNGVAGVASGDGADD